MSFPSSRPADAMDTCFEKSSGNVFEDLGFEREEAENLRIRAKLMLALTAYIRREGLRQEEAARLLAVTQPEISNLMNGKIQKFSIDKLVNMLSKIDMRIKVEAVPA